MAHTETIDRTGAALWFGFLGGAGAWTAHLLLAYFFAEFGCVGALRDKVFLGLGAPAAIIALFSAALVFIAAAATAVAYRAAKHMGLSIMASAEAEERQGHAGAAIYLARAGVIMSGLFVFIILVQSLPIFYFLRYCPTSLLRNLRLRDMALL